MDRKRTHCFRSRSATNTSSIYIFALLLFYTVRYEGAAASLVRRPHLESKTSDYGIEGGQLELNCTVEAELGSKLDFKWRLPSKKYCNGGRVQEIAPVSKNHGKNGTLLTGRLIVSNLKKEKDTGLYTCSIMNDSGNRNSDVLRVVKILGPEEWFLEINDKNGKVNDTLIVNSGTREAKWLVQYRGYPLPTMMWRDPRGNEIPWSTTKDESRKIEAIDEKYKHEIILTIRQPKISDSGIYTLYADNDHIQKKREFKLLVREKPQVSMDGISIESGTPANMSCSVYGFPLSNILWEFIPCENVELDKCNEKNKIKYSNDSFETVQETQFDQTSTLYFTSRSSGIAICSAFNPRGSSEARASVIVDKSHHHSATKLVDKPCVKSNTWDYGIEGGQLELTCSVTAELGSKLDFKWKLPKKSTAKEEGRVQEFPPISKHHEKDKMLYIATGRLIVSNLQKDKDTGVYNCSIINDSGNRNSDDLRVVKILEKPTVSMDGVSVKPNEVTKISCAIYGFPISDIKWEFIPCEKLELDEKSCEESKKITLTNTTVKTVEVTQFNQTSTLTFTPPSTGIAICTANNTRGNGITRANVILNDLDEDFIIWNSNELPIYAGDDVTVTCGASAHKYATELNWYKDDVLVESDDNVAVKSYNTKYSHREKLHWKSIPSAAIGKYVCRANVVKDGTVDDKTWNLEILEPTGPHLEDSNIKNGLVVETLIGEPLQFRCKYSGKPHPTVKWYKDGSEIVPEKNASRITLHDNNTVLDIQFLKDEDDGKYKCVASNRIGTESQEIVLEIINSPQASKALIFGILGLALVLLIIAICLYRRFRREQRRNKELSHLRAKHMAHKDIRSVGNDYVDVTPLRISN